MNEQTQAERLAEVLERHYAMGVGAEGMVECACGEDLMEWEIDHDPTPEHAEHQAAAVLAHLEAQGWAQMEPVFADGLVNDGVHEYSDAYNCDGMFIRRWKRTPRLEAAREHTPWEPVDG